MSGRVVIVGAGQAGFQVAASLRERGFAGPVTLVGEEPGLPYQRPPLSKTYLAGKSDGRSLLLRQAAFYATQAIELLQGTRAMAIDRASRRVVLGDGRTLPYDHLVLATGARDRALPLPGVGLDGVVRLRTRAQADALAPLLPSARNLVVIGAGFIGLEIASMARGLGLEVQVVELAPRPLARAVSVPISRFCRAAQEAAGTRLLLGTSVAAIHERDGRVAAVQTTDGRILPADLVLLGIGVVPCIELAAEAGLAVEDGIVVDAHLLTGDPAISAVGDCACFPGAFAGGAPVRLESVQNAVDQGRAVAARLTGAPAPYAAVPWFWSDQGALRLQMAGITAGHDAAILRGDPAAGRFSVFCFRGPHLLGVESVGSPGEHMIARRLLAAAATITQAQAADPAFDLKTLAARG